jgi:hypothetical protein
MIVSKNNYVKEKHILIRALENNNITLAEYDKKITILEDKIRNNIIEKLKENDKLIKDIKNIKKNIQYDGDLKRAIAKLFINFLEPYLTKDEIKGCFRQGYKLMRG